MTTLQAIVIGLLQGLTEFLPISSTAHIRIVPSMLGWDDPGAAFTAVVQLGTMAAELIYFRKDLWNIARGFVSGLLDGGRRDNKDFRLGLYIVLGTIPISILGLLLRNVIEGSARSLYVIGTMLVVVGLVLLFGEKRGKRTRKLESLRLRDGIIIGFAQAAALIPGVSRSGATLSAGMLLNLERGEAARYSFLLSIPAVVLSGLFEARKIGDGIDLAPTLVAAALAFVVGYLAIAGLLRFLTSHSTLVFVIYRVLLGSLVLGLAWAGIIS